MTAVQSPSFKKNWTLLIHYKARIKQAKTTQELNFIMKRLDHYQQSLIAQLN